MFNRYAPVGASDAHFAAEAIKTRHPVLCRLIRDCFPPNLEADILDVGCGCGGLISVARELGYQRIRGIDVSPEQVAIARQLGIEGIDREDLFETLRVLDPESQDVIVTYDVIEHLSKQQIEDLVHEIYRVLRKTGRWIIHAPNGESPFFGRILYGDFTHQQAFTRASIRQLVCLTGFKGVIFAEDSPIPHGLKSTIRSILWKISRSILQIWLLIETGSGDQNTYLLRTFARS